jgi:uncharacterized protein (DUF983 family)
MVVKETEHQQVHYEVQPSKFSAFLAQTCPHCHAGPVFKHPTFSLKFMQMYDKCTVCGQKYEIEPGFFWGSMYISYFMTVIIGFAVGFTDFQLVPNPPVLQVIGLICIALLILSPVSFRYSRMIMLYSFASIKFDPNAGK